MLLAAFDAPGRDGPGLLSAIYLVPSCANGLTGARRRQNGEFEYPGRDARASSQGGDERWQLAIMRGGMMPVLGEFRPGGQRLGQVTFPARGVIALPIIEHS